MKNSKENGKNFIKSNIFDLFDINSEPEINAVLDFKLTLSGNDASEYYKACLNILKQAELDNKLTELKQSYDNEQNLERKGEIAKQIQVLTMEKLKKTRRN